ncbi:hypothetical protein RclHR1_05770014 [Rhizophagus clarus]|nr:hypothetical protein RclHR1_05770014 [Rhizophagus clarus]
MQIFAIVIINIGYVILGIVQLIDIKIYRDKIESMCPGIHLNNNLVSYELPHILVLAVIATLITTLSWKLYQQFGWNIYKKIGGDVKMQIFFFQALAYKSIEKEWKFGIVAFILFWVFVVSDFAYLALKLGVALFIQFGIYSWIILMGNFTVCAMLTFAYAIIVMINFDKGLREYLDKNLPNKELHKSSDILFDDDDDIVINKFKDIENGEKGQSSTNNVEKFIIDE